MAEQSAEAVLRGERERRRTSLLRARRRIQLARAAGVGALAGFAGVAFEVSLFYAETLRTHALLWLKTHPAWGWMVLPCCGFVMAGIAGEITARYAPEAGGSGIPHIKGVLLHLRELNWKRILPVKFVAGVLAIGAGMSLGREGPAVQIGACFGKAFSDVLKLPRRVQPSLIACGAGAGLAAVFNAPLAGFLFVIEELQRELSALTYGTSFVAAVTAVAITRALTGQLPSFHIQGYPTAPLTALPLFGVVGLLTGLGGVYYNRCLLWCTSFFRSWKQPPWFAAATMGAVAAATAWWVPLAVGGGHNVAEQILQGRFAGAHLLSFLVLLFAVKFALTVFSYGTGVPGGIFAPLLVLGAILGLIVGQASAIFFPDLAQTPAAFSVVGMAAFFAASIRAPLTGIVLILEMTGNQQQLFALLVACLTAYVVAEHLGDKPVYEAMLEQDLRRTGMKAADHSEPILVDFAVEPESEMQSKRVRDLGLPPGCLVVTIDRGGTELVPSGSTRLRAGDRVSVIIAGVEPGTLARIQAKARPAHLHPE
ncbi:MAG: H(+)/Cl(-) exchange transporter ClcA [Armatimonadetes bacterium]|nr:H(+)/Cl(-) exchange transporter ClcA [Armatimonadota bacterium]